MNIEWFWNGITVCAQHNMTWGYQALTHLLCFYIKGLSCGPSVLKSNVVNIMLAGPDKIWAFYHPKMFVYSTLKKSSYFLNWKIGLFVLSGFLLISSNWTKIYCSELCAIIAFSGLKLYISLTQFPKYTKILALTHWNWVNNCSIYN